MGWLVGVVLAIFVALGAYETVYWLDWWVEGYPRVVRLGRHVLPGVPLGTAADLVAAVALAAATVALAYAAFLQADAAAAQARIAVSLEGVRISEQMVAEAQRDATQALARAAAAQLASSEATRKSMTFPDLRVVTHGFAVGGDRVGVVPGMHYRQAGEPWLGVENAGKGAALDLAVLVSWKLREVAVIEMATQSELSQASWEAPPVTWAIIDRLEPGQLTWVDLPTMHYARDPSNSPPKHATGLWFKVAWIDPDGAHHDRPTRGLELVAKSKLLADGTAHSTWEYLAFGEAAEPPDAAFSRPSRTSVL